MKVYITDYFLSVLDKYCNVLDVIIRDNERLLSNESDLYSREEIKGKVIAYSMSKKILDELKSLYVKKLESEVK